MKLITSLHVGFGYIWKNCSKNLWSRSVLSYEKWILPTLLWFVLLLLLVSLSFFFGALLFVRVVSLHIFPPNIYTMDIQLMGCSYDIDWFVLYCFDSILVFFFTMFLSVSFLTIKTHIALQPAFFKKPLPHLHTLHVVRRFFSVL